MCEINISEVHSGFFSVSIFQNFLVVWAFGSLVLSGLFRERHFPASDEQNVDEFLETASAYRYFMIKNLTLFLCGATAQYLSVWYLYRFIYRLQVVAHRRITIGASFVYWKGCLLSRYG